MKNPVEIIYNPVENIYNPVEKRRTSYDIILGCQEISSGRIQILIISHLHRRWTNFIKETLAESNLLSVE